MRTTVDVDDALYEQAAQRFPEGTPKRVVFNEALRALASQRRARPPTIGAFAHVPVRMHADFDDPVPGFEP